MTDIIGISLFALVAAGLGILIWLGFKMERERFEALGRLAEEWKWAFSGHGKNEGFDHLHPQFKCFQIGHGRYAYNQMRGSLRALARELEVQAGDFHYRATTSSGKNRRTKTHQFSYFLVTVSYNRLPGLALRPEGFMDKLAGAIGFEDVDFESAEFSRRYHVSSGDRRFAYDVLHPRMIEWMLEAEPPAFELSNGVLLVVSGESRWDPEEFRQARSWVEAFLSRWPDYLVKDLGAG